MTSIPVPYPIAQIEDSLNKPMDTLRWPKKHKLFGVGVSATTYREIGEVLIDAAQQHRPTIVDFTPVSVLVEAATDPAFREQLNSFDIVCPDGQPVRWCLNYFHHAHLNDTVCGTTATLHLCSLAEHKNIGVYLYGSTADTLRQFRVALQSRFPRLRIAGSESPPFRLLTAEELSAVVDRINASEAGLVFLGVGSPKQEYLAWELKSRIGAVQLCVGAAFDFVAGTRKRAPRFIQKMGLEWLYRVCQEPLRLGKRYALGNLHFAVLVLNEIFRARFAQRAK